MSPSRRGQLPGEPERGPLEHRAPAEFDARVCNVERRLKTAVRRANERLAELGIEPISERVTPHSLRRTYASLRYALGDDPIYVAAQMGHEESSLSMRVYARAVKRRERLTGTYRREFDRALEWAQLGRMDAPEREIKALAPKPASMNGSGEPIKSLQSPDSSGG